MNKVRDFSADSGKPEETGDPHQGTHFSVSSSFHSLIGTVQETPDAYCWLSYSCFQVDHISLVWCIFPLKALSVRLWFFDGTTFFS